MRARKQTKFVQISKHQREMFTDQLRRKTRLNKHKINLNHFPIHDLDSFNRASPQL